MGLFKHHVIRRLLCAFVFLVGVSIMSCSDSGTGPDPEDGNGDGGEETTTYTVSVTSSSSDAGTVSPSGENTYDEGEEIELQADPNEGYLFTEWTGDIESTDNPYSLTVDQNYDITANFEVKSYELTVNKEGEGTVNEEVLEQKSKEYEHGTVVELTANPAEGYKFVEWQGDITGSDNPAEITVDEPKEVTAVFEKKSYELTIHTDGEGAVSEEIVQEKATDYEHGTVVELMADPAEGWKFVEWQGDVEGTDNPAEITVDEPKEVTAVFEKKSYELTIHTEGEGAVSEEIVQQKATDYEHGTVVELTANPTEGWQFAEWQGDITGAENPAEITVDGQKEVTAVFEKKTYNLKINTAGNGSVAKTPDQSEYAYGTEVTLEATPDEGWQFTEWTGDKQATDNPLTFTITSDTEITANFSEEQATEYELSVSASPSSGGSVSPSSGTFEEGTEVTVEATANEGYAFTGWMGDIESNDNPLTFTITEDTELTADFSEEQSTEYELSVSTSPSNGGSVDPSSGTFEKGSEITVEATAKKGWEFTGWSGDMESSENPLAFTITEDTELTANFSKKEYSLTVQTNPSGGGSVSPSSGTYEYGTEVTVEATANEGYTFTEWTGDQQSTDNPLTFTITSDTEITANFSEAFVLDASADPKDGGTVEVSPDLDRYESGTEVRVEAIPNEGWEFTGWTGDKESTASLLKFEMNKDTKLTANFSRKEYGLNVRTNPSNVGSVEPSSGMYKHGTEVTVEATPEVGWEFAGWSGDIESTDNPLTFMIEEYTRLTANFEEKESIYTMQMMATDTEDTLEVHFGQQKGATRAFNDGLDQYAPPSPPSGVFHAYFEINSIFLFKDFRSMMAKDEQWNFHYQLGSGDQLKLGWELTDDTKTPGNLILTDNDNSFEVNMFNKTSYTISGNQSGELIIRYSFE